MVQILVSAGQAGLDEDWLLVELQGHVVPRGGGGLQSATLGDLHYTRDGIPVLIIGHHILYGKVVSLDKPLAVLVKQQHQQHQQHQQQQHQQEEMDAHPELNSTDVTPSVRTQYLVQALVHTKLLFKTRPKPIITNVPRKV
ncbi:chromosome transmission fidelity protein 8 homolog [Petromyzon marinus]|uniref:chromosome transmission fidelity protein 8 homolog n=1 Tax=Petromyzon marinus TaxID=7757 RepID=UPI003F6FFB92